jgi:hypothetical protein
MNSSPTWDWGQMVGCDPEIEVTAAGMRISLFDLNPDIIWPFDYLEIKGPPDKTARFATWILDPDPGAPDIANTEAYALPGGSQGLASDLIPLSDPSWP